MLQPGTYKLATTVKNPRPDRRKKDDWTAAPTFEAGATFVVIVAGEGVPHTIKRIGCNHHDRIHASDERALALEPHLTPTDETIGAMFLRLDVYSWYLPRFLRYLIESGVFTPAEFERHLTTWLTSGDD